MTLARVHGVPEVGRNVSNVLLDQVVFRVHRVRVDRLLRRVGGDRGLQSPCPILGRRCTPPCPQRALPAWGSLLDADGQPPGEKAHPRSGSSPIRGVNVEAGARVGMTDYGTPRRHDQPDSVGAMSPPSPYVEHLAASAKDVSACSRSQGRPTGRCAGRASRPPS